MSEIVSDRIQEAATAGPRIAVVPPEKHTNRHASIRARILLALLLISLVPLALFVALNLYSISTAEKYIKSELVRDAEKDVFRLVKVHAAAANATLNRVEAETTGLAIFAQALFNNPAAFGSGRSYGANERPDDPTSASKVVLAPGVTQAAAQHVLDLTANLDHLFQTLKKDNPNLEFIEIGTETGVFRRYPWDADTFERYAFSLGSAIAAPESDGPLPDPMRQVFKSKGFELSPDASVATVEPGRKWAVLDNKNDRSFNLRRGDDGIGVYLGYDPRQRPWYVAAVGKAGNAWTRFPQSGRGEYVFTLGPIGENALGASVSPALRQAFARQHIPLNEGSPISAVGLDIWALQDKNHNNYRIEQTSGKLIVYAQDILTSSQAVADSQGRTVGVVGLAMNMQALRKRLIHPPDEVNASAFLLNGKGELVDQERMDMFIPAPDSDLHKRMIAGETGQAFDEATGNYIFFAPIRPVRAVAGANSVWSLGMSVPETTITRLATDIQNRLFFILQLGVLLFFVLVPLPMIYAAMRTSKAIATPIVQLGEGAQRIGRGDLDYRVNVHTGDEIEALADNFNRMAGDLQTYIRDLQRTTADKERFESELRVAHDIQMSFLKKIFPPFPHRSELELHAAITPARHVGGDLYDFALLDDSRLFFYIGDVSDKGVPASLIMAITMTLMKRASLEPGATPASILRQVNVTLAEGNENLMFVTLFAGILNFATGELTFSNAGHNPPVIVSPEGEPTYLALPDGMVLGVMPESEYSDATVTLDHGAMIVTYTDGVTEAMNPEGHLYSEESLIETLAGLESGPVEATVTAIFASVKAHAAGCPQSDDIAVLAVRRI